MEATDINNDMSFFTVGLHANSPVYLTRQYIIPKLISHPIHIWEIFSMRIQRQEIEKGNKLKISKKVWEKVSADANVRAEQKKKVKDILNTRNDKAYSDCWSAPLKTKIVSKFASPRFLPSGKGYYHSGVDLRGWTGTPIKAAAGGKVVLAEHMIVPGNNVIISHGANIYSRYMHLDEINVKVDQVVGPDHIIGTTGSTGRVEGPHLHWEVYWKGQLADPHQFIEVWNRNCSPR